MSKVFLIDGSGYIFRAFFAVAPLSTKDGFPTNALYGFFRMMIKLLAQADSEHMVMVFDTGKPTFRHEMYKEYKANRAECPSELIQQMPYFRDISRAFGLKVIEQHGFEADDVIGTLARRFGNAGIETVVISGDKDLMQLVSDNVTIYDAMKDVWIGREQVKEKFGVPPEKVVEVLALMGDSSDNVPGLKGVGPKTATQLVDLFGDTETIINSVEKIRETKAIRGRDKLADTIVADPEILRLSKKLVAIDCEMPLTFELNGSGQQLVNVPDNDLYSVALRTEPNSEALAELAEKFEFSSLLRDFKSGATQVKKEAPKRDNYKTIYREDFPEFISKLKSVGHFVFDTETTSLDLFDSKLVGLAFCWNNEEAFYVPLGHTEVPAGKTQISFEEAKAQLAPIFMGSALKSGQNMKYDIQVLANHGLGINNVYFDTMVAAYLLNPDRRSHGLSALSKDYLGLSVIEYEEVTADKVDFSHVDIPAATRYSAEDAHMAWLLIEKLHPLLKQRSLEQVFHDIEMPLVSILAKLERTGVKIDTDLLSRISKDFESQLALLEKQLYEIAGGEFNINSTQQLSAIMFDKLGIQSKGLKKTKTGKISTNQGVLEQLADSHPFPSLVLRYRSLYKLKSTYVDVLPTLISPQTHRLHSRFNQTVTGTGRLSSSDPNLQNIPIRTSEGASIRAAFIADPGNLILTADYSQIELRLLAHLSGDENLIQTFIEDVDIHTRTAREILGLMPGFPISADERRIGKTINFGIVYGMGPFRLSKELEIPMSTAKAYIENYFNQYPKVQKYFDSLERDIQEKGYVQTLFGRKRNVADIDTTGRDKEFVIRAALNAPLQGTAADIIKLAMLRLESALKDTGAKLILQVHDELVFEVPEAQLDKIKELVREKMENVVQLKVPLKVGIGSGKNWQEAH
jgi:DNA polymerase-1